MTQKNNRWWLIGGFIWALLMFLIMSIATPLSEGKTLEGNKLIIDALLWIVSGFTWSYIVMYLDKRGRAKKEKDSNLRKAQP